MKPAQEAAAAPPPDRANEDEGSEAQAMDTTEPALDAPHTPDLEAAAEPTPADNGESMGWADLVEAQHGGRRAPEADSEPDVSRLTPEPLRAAPDTEQRSTSAGELRGQMSAISDEMKAGIGSLIEDLRSSIRGTSESARAEIDRLAEDLRARLKQVEAEVEHQTQGISDQVGRIDDKVADAVEQLHETAGALRKRIDATESASEGLKEDIQELALRIERGLAESADRVASVADGLESSFGSRLSSIGSTAREDNIQLGREVESLKERSAALETLLHNVLDGLEAQAGAHSKPVPEFTGTLALNSATFEQLRGLGFSVTQSARIIAYRDTHGGLKSMEQLREVRGLSQEDLKLLTDRATL